MGDLQREASLEVRLLHNRPCPTRVGGLKVGVKVGRAINWVVEAVQSLARVGVEAARLDLQHMLARTQDGQGEAGSVPGHHGRLSVDAERIDRLPHEVHPQSFGLTSDVQMHSAVDREDDLTGIDGSSDVDCHVVGGHLAHRGPPRGFLVTQVREAVRASRSGRRHVRESSQKMGRMMAEAELSSTSPRHAREWSTACGRCPRRRRCGGRCANRRNRAAPG